MKIPPLQTADRSLCSTAKDKLKFNVTKVLIIKRPHAIVQSQDEIKQITLKPKEQQNCMGGQYFLRKGAESWQGSQY